MRQSTVVIAGLLLLGAIACNTGVESVPPITDRDVTRSTGRLPERQHSSLTPYADSIALWQPGKAFHVVNDRARLILEPQPAGTLAGTTLHFLRFDEQPAIDKPSILIVILQDSLGNTFRYNTERPRDAVSHLTIPFLIDLDMVSHYNSLLAGKRFYILTREWRDETTKQPLDGRLFIPVVINSVEPGNEVYPLRVIFTDPATEERAMIWVMTDETTSVSHRNFDSQFAPDDPRTNYRYIRDDAWQCIIDGRVKQGMTREECRLALGQPRDIVRLPDYGGLHEHWYYDGGRVLRFSDGILDP